MKKNLHYKWTQTIQTHGIQRPTVIAFAICASTLYGVWYVKDQYLLKKRIHQEKDTHTHTPKDNTEETDWLIHGKAAYSPREPSYPKELNILSRYRRIWLFQMLALTYWDSPGRLPDVWSQIDKSNLIHWRSVVSESASAPPVNSERKNRYDRWASQRW